MTEDERFTLLWDTVKGSGRRDAFVAALGFPHSVGQALRVWHMLEENAWGYVLDRLYLELGFGEEIEW